MKPRFSYIYPRRPKVGQLVRSTNYGSLIYIVHAVEGQYVWLRRYATTNANDKWKGAHPKNSFKHEWRYQPTYRYREFSPADNAFHQAEVEKVIASYANGDDPKYTPQYRKPSGRKRVIPGHWRTEGHRPVKENRYDGGTSVTDDNGGRGDHAVRSDT